jgi:hypothetical protein
MKPREADLISRVKGYASSVKVRDTPWLDLLMNDIIVKLTEDADEIERLRTALQEYDGAAEDWERSHD